MGSRIFTFGVCFVSTFHAPSFPQLHLSIWLIAVLNWSWSFHYRVILHSASNRNFIRWNRKRAQRNRKHTKNRLICGTRKKLICFLRKQFLRESFLFSAFILSRFCNYLEKNIMIETNQVIFPNSSKNYQTVARRRWVEVEVYYFLALKISIKIINTCLMISKPIIFKI